MSSVLRGVAGRVPVLGVGLLLSACTRIEFEIVEVERVGEDVSAVVELCGRSTKMERAGGSLRASVLINCEGGGYVRVHLGNRRIICRTGYVTSGMDSQHWRYRIRNGLCEDVLDRPRPNQVTN